MKLLIFFFALVLITGCKDTVSSLWPVFLITGLPTAYGFYLSYKQSKSGSFRIDKETGKEVDLKSNMKIWETPAFKLACIGLIAFIGSIIWANLEK